MTRKKYDSMSSSMENNNQRVNIISKSAKPLCIVIAGGAVRGIGMLGALQYIDSVQNLEQVHSFFGTSMGSILAYWCCIGYKPIDVVHMLIQSNLLKAIQNDISVNTILQDQGIFKFDCIRDELEISTLSRYGKLFTMKSLYDELGKEFCCVSFNYSKNRTEILHHTTTPDLDCITAIQMSSSIPFVFNKCIVNNMLYIDGAISDNFPIRVALKMGHSNIIGIVSFSTIEQPIPDVSTSEDSPPTLEISKILSLPISKKTKKTIRKYQRKYLIIDIPLSEDALNFNLDISEIMDMFSRGYKICRIIFNS